MARNRLVHSIASSLSRVSISAQPPTSSFASENGPSSTVNSPSAYLTLVASSTGPRPPVASSTPALVASSTKAPILANISGLGGGIGTDGSARVYPRNRISSLLRVCGPATVPVLVQLPGDLRPTASALLPVRRAARAQIDTTGEVFWTRRGAWSTSAELATWRCPSRKLPRGRPEARRLLARRPWSAQPARPGSHPSLRPVIAGQVPPRRYRRSRHPAR